MKDGRSNTPEWMERPETSASDLEEALQDIRWVNRFLGGTSALLWGLTRLWSRCPVTPLRVLDLGCGSADIPLAIVDWALPRNIDIRITAVDIHPVAVGHARRLCQTCPQITVMQGDALNLPFNHPFDITISSMFMHHLSDPEIPRLVAAMARMSEIGFVINDLERHPTAYHAIDWLGKLARKGRIFRHDAPLSVRRGFTRPELIRHLENADLEEQGYRWAIHRKFPFRFLVTANKGG